jgi:hypothetical protein
MIKVVALSGWLDKKRKIYSLDLLSGWTCPFAKECLSKVTIVQIDGLPRKKIKDGPDTLFRCFSASQEVVFPAVYNSRKHNTDTLQEHKSVDDIAEEIQASLPQNAGIVRIHVGGDFYNLMYFLAWLKVARDNPSVLFYAYTKSLRWWVANLGGIPENMVLTASRGGREDHLIGEYNLREAIVIADPNDCQQIYDEGLTHWKGLPIDHDDSHAAIPQTRGESFYLLVHGPQMAGSDSGKAVRNLKGKGSYGRKSPQKGGD